MDQQNISTLSSVVNATQEFLQSQITQKDSRIQQLEEHINRVTQRDYSTSATLNSLREAMREWTLEALQEREISETNAEEIADICGFELTNEVEVEVSVTYNFTVQVGHDEDAEDIINDIDFDAITYDVDKITWVSSSINGIDF
jgi:DNA repair exonuclease SbcCD ATPase subunit